MSKSDLLKLKCVNCFLAYHFFSGNLSNERNPFFRLQKKDLNKSLEKRLVLVVFPSHK